MTRRSLLSILVAALLVLTLPGVAAAKQPDRDRDGMPDRWERKNKLSVKTDDAARDPDRDGLRNVAEYRSKTNPRKPDSDRDGRLDGDEDRDRDRVDNANEDRERTHPGRKDSDGDGVRDCDEDADRDGLDNEGEDVTGNDPIDPDSDDDGVEDGAEAAGRIESFVEDVLTVRPVRGDAVRGLVTDETVIACESEDELEYWDEDWDDETDADEDWLGVRGATRAGDEGGGTGGGKDWDWDEDDEVEDEESCGVDALVPGTGVHEAELVLTADGPLFTKIEVVAAD